MIFSISNIEIVAFSPCIVTLFLITVLWPIVPYSYDFMNFSFVLKDF